MKRVEEKQEKAEKEENKGVRKEERSAKIEWVKFGSSEK